MGTSVLPVRQTQRLSNEASSLHLLRCATHPACRHILEYMVAHQTHASAIPDVSQLASSHEDVTIMFTE